MTKPEALKKEKDFSKKLKKAFNDGVRAGKRTPRRKALTNPHSGAEAEMDTKANKYSMEGKMKRRSFKEMKRLAKKEVYAAYTRDYSD